MTTTTIACGGHIIVWLGEADVKRIEIPTSLLSGSGGKRLPSVIPL